MTCSKTPAGKVLGAKHYGDRQTFLKSLRDFPQTRRLSEQDILSCLNKTEKPALRYTDTLPLTKLGFAQSYNQGETSDPGT